ncbi:MAG: ABC transporter ATP-binding protein [Candidatus Micrarchaeia archaeon]
MKKDKPVLELRNVTKCYGEADCSVVALDGATFTINEGEFVAIIGPSGSGKSTLLHQIGLLDEPTTGEILVNGINTVDMKEDQKAELRNSEIGFVFQTFNLIPSLNSLENVEIVQTIAGIEKTKRYKNAFKVLEKVGMEKRLTHLSNQLSGGERQRVAIARALINDPKIILADEPTGNLDSKRGEEILKIFKDLNKEGKTIIIITHDLSIAKKAQRIIKIRDGKIEGE